MGQATFKQKGTERINEPGALLGKARYLYPTFRLLHHTHIIVVAHVHPTVKHYVFPGNRHKDTAAPHILASSWMEAKTDK